VHLRRHLHLCRCVPRAAEEERQRLQRWRKSTVRGVVGTGQVVVGEEGWKGEGGEEEEVFLVVMEKEKPGYPHPPTPTAWHQ
jgi:hypothetical protein